MTSRDSRSELARVWADRTRYTLWLEVELAHLAARESAGEVPDGTEAAIRAAIAMRPLDPIAIGELEAATRSEVGAFLTHVEAQVGPAARLVHLGLCGSDIRDTAFALQLVMATDVILAGTDALLAALRARAIEHRHTPMIGRSHGMHSEVTTFGHALLSFWAEVGRGRAALVGAREEVAVGTLSGPVGTFAATGLDIEQAALEALGLRAEPASTQIVARDRHARYFGALAAFASSVERIAVAVRQWQRTEVGEVCEPSPGLPHERAPMGSESATGLARLVRAYASAALEDVAVWHEQDASHSTVERTIAPGATAATDRLVRRMAAVIEGLEVNVARMRANIELTRGLPFGGLIRSALVEMGLGRTQADAVVQRLSLTCASGGADLKTLVKLDAEVRRLLPDAAIDGCFELATALRHVDAIFQRVLGSPSE